MLNGHEKKPATLFRFQVWWIFKTSNSLGASCIDRISPYFSLVDSQGILGSCVDQGDAIWALVFEKSPRCQLRMRLATKSVAFRHQRWLPIIYSFPLPCWEVSPLCWRHFLMKHLMWTIHFQAQSSIITWQWETFEIAYISAYHDESTKPWKEVLMKAFILLGRWWGCLDIGTPNSLTSRSSKDVYLEKLQNLWQSLSKASDEASESPMAWRDGRGGDGTMVWKQCVFFSVVNSCGCSSRCAHKIELVSPVVKL